MIHPTDDETFQLMLDCHTVAPFRLVRAAAPYMRIKEVEARENRSVIWVRGRRGGGRGAAGTGGACGMCCSEPGVHHSSHSHPSGLLDLRHARQRGPDQLLCRQGLYVLPLLAPSSPNTC